MKMGLVLDMMIMETVLGFYQRNRTTRAYVCVCVCCEGLKKDLKEIGSKFGLLIEI